MIGRSSGVGWMAKGPLLAALVLAAPAGSLYAQDPSPAEQQDAPAATPPNDAGPADSDGAQFEAIAPLPRGKKLMLTDGSFHVVREYRREGDRARYYSVERSAWEEIPASLVDWEATEKASAETEAQQQETVERLQATRADDVAAMIDSDRSLEVRPGVFLPDAPGFYALDGRTILTMAQESAVARVDRTRAAARIITGLPLISTKHRIEVAGKRAKIRVHVGEPEFYIRTNDGRNPRLTLLQAEVQGDKRRITTASTDLAGTVKYEHREAPILTWEAARGVQRLTMGQKLTPGEYALVETTAEGLSMYVWDFGVDAAPSPGKAPAGTNTDARPAGQPNTR